MAESDGKVRVEASERVCDYRADVARQTPGGSFGLRDAVDHLLEADKDVEKEKEVAKNGTFRTLSGLIYDSIPRRTEISKTTWKHFEAARPTRPNFIGTHGRGQLHFTTHPTGWPHCLRFRGQNLADLEPFQRTVRDSAAGTH